MTCVRFFWGGEGKDKEERLISGVAKCQINKIYERLCLMNHSPDKSYAIEGGEDLEYNSKYIQSSALMNISPDLPGLSPVGKNFVTDENTLFKNIKETVSSGMAPIECVPLLCHIAEKELTKVYINAIGKAGQFQGMTMLKVLQNEGSLEMDRVLPCHGGKHIMSPTSIHLDKMILGYTKGLYDIEYVLRCSNPESAISFCIEGKKMVLFSSSSKKLITEEYTSHAMKTMWRENRTALNSKKGRENLMLAKRYKKVRDTCRSIAPEIGDRLEINIREAEREGKIIIII